MGCIHLFMAGFMDLYWIISDLGPPVGTKHSAVLICCSYFIIPLWCFCIWQNYLMRLRLLKYHNNQWELSTHLWLSVKGLTWLSKRCTMSKQPLFLQPSGLIVQIDVGWRDYQDLQISYMRTLLLWRLSSESLIEETCGRTDSPKT